MSIAIRRAKLSDAPALAALMCELGYETSNAEMHSRLQAILRNESYSTIVAEVDIKLCGMIGTLTHASHEHNAAHQFYEAFGYSKTGFRFAKNLLLTG